MLLVKTEIYLNKIDFLGLHNWNQKNTIYSQ